MRQFLYYNQDSINSLLAQVNEGLLLKDKSSNSSDKISEILNGEIFSQTRENINLDFEIEKEIIKNLQEKILHDYAFDKLYDYFEKKSYIKKENYGIGDYISIKASPTFLDFSYLQGLFEKDGILELHYEQEKKELSKQLGDLKKNIPKGKSMPETIKVQIKKLEEEMKNNSPSNQETHKMISAIRMAVPYNRFMIINNLLVPLTDKYFRDDPEIVAFKYGGEMSLFGCITNSIQDTEEIVDCNSFSSLFNVINKMMLNLVIDQKTMFIVHPITMFY